MARVWSQVRLLNFSDYTIAYYQRPVFYLQTGLLFAVYLRNLVARSSFFREARNSYLNLVRISYKIIMCGAFVVLLDFYCEKNYSTTRPRTQL